MSSNNILYICNAMLQNVVIMTDANGKNELDSLRKFKYNNHLASRLTNNLKNDSVLIDDTIHSNCVIIVDEHGNNMLKTEDEISISTNINPDLENNLFIEVLKQVHTDKEPANIEEFLFKKRESLQSKLKTAIYFFNMKSFIKACDLYKEVLTIIETDVYPDEFMLKDTDILAIKFAYALSKMAICKIDELQSAANMLITLKTEHGDKFPTLYYYLARCLFLLEKYDDAKDVLVSGENLLKNVDDLSELNWPGSDNKMIVRTEKPILQENIQSLFKECNEFRLPDIKCTFLRCENKNIFFDSPCFNGYVIVKCSKKCNFTYHRNCWKMKLKADCVKKPSYFLGNICATDDCGGIISDILIYDENLHLNSFIVPKVVTSADKHEEKHSVTCKQSTNGRTKTISDVPKKNTSKKNVGASKKEKKSIFNLNAKEYVPATLSEEYVPPRAGISNAENEGRVNLFDIVPNAGVNKFTDESYNLPFARHEQQPIANYSEEDGVSVDFVGDGSNSMQLKKANEETHSKYSQTNNSPKLTYLNSIEITTLSNELALLQSQLFQAEEDYNNVLAQNNSLQKQLHDALAKLSMKCDNCTKFQSVVAEKESEKSAALLKLNELEEENSDLKVKLKELQNALSFEQKEKQSSVEYNKSLAKRNEILQEKVNDLLGKMKAVSQHHAYMAQHDNLRKAMFDQIANVRHAYASYFTLYENKSKHMLWELEDIKALSTPQTLPTLAEVEENMAAWEHALDNSVKSRYMMNGFYEHLFRQFSYDQNNGNGCPMPMPMPMPMSFPSFIVEPPNIIIRHFKSLIIVNKRLEQELHQQMNSFYKMMSTPYPGVFPQKNPEVMNTAETATTPEKNHQTTDRSVLQNNTSENIPEQVSPLNKSHSESPAQNPNSKWNSSSAGPNMYDNLMTSSTALGPTSTSRKITKQSFLSTNINTTDVINSRKENNPNPNQNDTNVKCDSGTMPRNNIIEAQNRNSPTTQNPTKPKPDVVGPESLVNKLHQKLPLVPVNLISRAVSILRERSGGLTGKDSKQIIAEIKQILKEIAITEKCLRKSKESPAEKPIKTWKKVNNGVHWNNEDPDVNCTICFEFMSPEKRMKLRCQHIFHQTCIKLWLQNDSVCPICRSFATLDDEFPPLK